MHRAVTRSWQHTVLTYPVEFLHKKRNNYQEWKWAVLTSRGTGTPAEPLHANKWSEMTKWLIWNWNRHCPQTPLTSQHVLQMSKSGPGDQHLSWWEGGERDRMSLAVAWPRCFTVNGGKPRHVKVNRSIADGDENGVQIYFLSILGVVLPPPPSLSQFNIIYSTSSQGHFSTVFSFLKYVRQLDGISPRDKSSQEVEKKINALPSTRRREKTKRTKARLWFMCRPFWLCRVRQVLAVLAAPWEERTGGS